MKLGHCYQMTYQGREIIFRVIKNDTNTILTVRLCGSEETVEIYVHGILERERVTIREVECMSCDGKPSLEEQSRR